MRNFVLMLAAAYSLVCAQVDTTPKPLKLAAVTIDTLRSNGDSCQVIVDSTGKEIGKTCKSVSIFKHSDVFPGLSYGVGVPALSFNTSTWGIGFLSAIDPITLTFNNVQRIWVRNSEVHKLALWTTSFGLSVSKADSGAMAIGVSFVPWGVRVDNYVFGVGVRYTATDRLEFNRRSLSIIVPITYSL